MAKLKAKQQTFDPDRGPVLSVRFGLALLLMVVGHRLHRVLLPRRARPRGLHAEVARPAGTGPGFMRDLGGWNYVIGFGVFFARPDRSPRTPRPPSAAAAASSSACSAASCSAWPGSAPSTPSPRTPRASRSSTTSTRRTSSSASSSWPSASPSPRAGSEPGVGSRSTPAPGGALPGRPAPPYDERVDGPVAVHRRRDATRARRGAAYAGPEPATAGPRTADGTPSAGLRQDRAGTPRADQAHAGYRLEAELADRRAPRRSWRSQPTRPCRVLQRWPAHDAATARHVRTPRPPSAARRRALRARGLESACPRVDPRDRGPATTSLAVPSPTGQLSTGFSTPVERMTPCSYPPLCPQLWTSRQLSARSAERSTTASASSAATPNDRRPLHRRRGGRRAGRRR